MFGRVLDWLSRQVADEISWSKGALGNFRGLRDCLVAVRNRTGQMIAEIGLVLRSGPVHLMCGVISGLPAEKTSRWFRMCRGIVEMHPNRPPLPLTNRCRWPQLFDRREN